MTAAKLDESAARYRDLAPRYDYYTRRIDRVRGRAIEALGLRPGETVLDAGCGTGWCFAQLAEAVGGRGRVIAFDPSPEMLSVARRRVSAGRVPIEVLMGTAEEIRLPAAPGAILLSYTHDLIRSRAALENLFAQAAPGARVAATSTKLYAPWLFPANWYLRYSHRAYITNFEGFEAPWSLLAELLDDFRVDTHGLTQHYVATGRVRGD